MAIVPLDKSLPPFVLSPLTFTTQVKKNLEKPNKESKEFTTTPTVSNTKTSNIDIPLSDSNPQPGDHFLLSKQYFRLICLFQKNCTTLVSNPKYTSLFSEEMQKKIATLKSAANEVLELNKKGKITELRSCHRSLIVHFRNVLRSYHSLKQLESSKYQQLFLLLKPLINTFFKKNFVEDMGEALLSKYGAELEKKTSSKLNLQKNSYSMRDIFSSLYDMYALISTCSDAKITLSRKHLYDSFKEGNFPSFIFTNGQTSFYRSAAFTRDLQRDPNTHELLAVEITPEFLFFLETTPSHVYVNLMNRVAGTEKVRSAAIEGLDRKNKNCHIFTLDRSSSFYNRPDLSSPPYIDQFKQAFFNKMFKENSSSSYFYWSSKINITHLQNICIDILDHVHHSYFEHHIKLSPEEKRFFIEQTYVYLIEAITKHLKAKTCNVSCRICVDRGASLLTHLFLQHIDSTKTPFSKEDRNKLFGMVHGMPYHYLRRSMKPVLLGRVFETGMNYLSRINWQAKYNKKVTSILSDTHLRSSIDKLNKQFLGYIQKNHPAFFTFPSFSNARKDQTIEQMLFHYYRSFDTFAPLIALYADHLLKRSANENSELIFLARDGTAFLKIAEILLDRFPDQHPNIEKKHLKLAYLSRRIVHPARTNKAEKIKLRQYLKQLGIEKNKTYILVDIGFKGSMVDLLQATIKDLGANAKFSFLYCTTNKAESFLNPSPIKFNAFNLPGVHWMEDLHQGVVKSPVKLVTGSDRLLYPNTKTNKTKITCANQPKPYMLRKVARWALKDAAKTLDLKAISKEKAEKCFSNFLIRVYKKTEASFITHIVI